VKATVNTGNETLLWKHHRYDFSNGVGWGGGAAQPGTGIGYRVDFSAGDSFNQITWFIYTPNPVNTGESIEYALLATIILK